MQPLRVLQEPRTLVDDECAASSRPWHVQSLQRTANERRSWTVVRLPVTVDDSYTIQVSTVTVLKRLGRAIRGMDEPAVEKISEDTREDPFRVLIATMLSAQTRDPVTHAASTRLFRVARTPQDDGARCRRATIQRLIYPVSFYRVKARARARDVPRRSSNASAGSVPGHDGGAADAARRGPEDRESRADPVAREPGQHLRGHARPPASPTGSAGCARGRPIRPSRRSIACVPRRWWPRVNLYPGHLGAERLPAGLSAMPGVRREPALS